MQSVIQAVRSGLVVFVSAMGAMGAGASAQGIVSPSHFRVAEAPSVETRPFSTGTVQFHYQQIHDAVPAGTYRGLAFRRDGQRRSMPARSMNIELWISTARTTSTTAGRTTAANHGANLQRVRPSSMLLNLPATAERPRQRLPNPFEYSVPFAVPFTHRGGALAWEIRVLARSSGGTIYLDAVRGPKAAPATVLIPLGSGCKSSARNRRVDLSFGMSHNWRTLRGTWTFGVNDLPPSRPVTLAIGTDSLAVPFRIPGSGTAASGACDVHLMPVLSVGQLADARGQLQLNAAVQLWPGLHGQHFSSQAFALDPGANPAGVVTSGALMRQIRYPWSSAPVASLYYRLGQGSATPNRNTGLITEFRR